LLPVSTSGSGSADGGVPSNPPVKKSIRKIKVDAGEKCNKKTMKPNMKNNKRRASGKEQIRKR